jgi:FkbM family methyltransferase
MHIFNFLYLVRQSFFRKINKNFYSQFGEDRVLKEILKKNINKGFYVDVGCYHPKKHSNTYLLYKKGWRGINIDIEKNKIEVFRMSRPDDINILDAVSDKKRSVKVHKTQDYGVGSKIIDNTKTKKNFKTLVTKTLNEVIEKTIYKNRRIDLLNIDTEGEDLNVLKSLNIKKYNPSIIIIESHLTSINEILKSKIYIFLVRKKYKLRSWNFFSLIFTLKNSTIVRNR